MARLSRILERACELSLAHYRVLAIIADGDERASRIAERLALGRPAISASVEALVRAGLITRTAAGDDQRAVALRVTPAGAAALTHAETAMAARLSELAGDGREGEDAFASLAWLGGRLDAVRMRRG